MKNSIFLIIGLLVLIFHINIKADIFFYSEYNISTVCHEDNYSDYILNKKFVYKKGRGCYLYEVNFENANFWEANFTGANLYLANFSNADLYKSNFDEAYLYKANFSKSDLYEVDFSGADLRFTNFNKASLYRAKLSGTKALGANFILSDFYRANLKGANFKGVDLNRSINLDKAIGLSEVICDDKTKFPGDDFLFRKKHNIICSF